MGGRITASAKTLKPDSRYNNMLVSKFINCIMWAGKKSVAQKVFNDAMDIISSRVKDTPAIEVFEAAINNVKPNVEVRSKRVGGATYQVPMPVNQKRQLSLSFRWIIHASRAGKGRPMANRLADEIIGAFKREGTAITTRENVHRMAEANKAFAHFAWR